MGVPWFKVVEAFHEIGYPVNALQPFGGIVTVKSIDGPGSFDFQVMPDGNVHLQIFFQDIERQRGEGFFPISTAHLEHLKRSLSLALESLSD